MTALIQLMAQHTWLHERALALNALQLECASEAELDLVFDLISRIDYLGNETLTEGFRAMSEQILTGWGLAPEKIIVCPPKVDSSADSGPAVVHVLKNLFGQRKIKGIELVISLKKLKDHAASRNAVIIADDFAGTGKTIADKLEIIREVRAYKQNPPSIFVCLLAASRLAREAIEPHVNGYFVWREYSKGISDHYAEPALAEAISVMQAIEGRLAPVVGTENLPQFGYGGTEVLLGWDSNLPNSVFPVFWWPESVPKRPGEIVERTTLFSRYFRGLN